MSEQSTKEIEDHVGPIHFSSDDLDELSPQERSEAVQESYLWSIKLEVVK